MDAKATMKHPLKCPWCGWVYDAARHGFGLTPVHPDVDGLDALCPGSEQHPRDSESDRRPLWKNDPELHGRTATVKPNRTEVNGTEPEAPKVKGGLTRDPELQAINRIMALLATLPPAVRERVVAYVHVRTQEQTAATLPRNDKGCE